MRDRLSVMLDSMIFAVDEGFSFDGIVSIPEIGLEDFGRRPGVVGWLDDGVELFRTTRTAISQVVDKLLSKAIRSSGIGRMNNRNRANNESNRRSTIRDSKFSPDDDKTETDPAFQVSPTSRKPRLSPSSQESPTPVLQESQIPAPEGPAVSQASHNDEESSQKDERDQTQHSRGATPGESKILPRKKTASQESTTLPMQDPTASQESQSSAPQGSTATQPRKPPPFLQESTIPIARDPTPSQEPQSSAPQGSTATQPRKPRSSLQESTILAARDTTAQESQSSAPQGTAVSQESQTDKSSQRKDEHVQVGPGATGKLAEQVLGDTAPDENEESRSKEPYPRLKRDRGEIEETCPKESPLPRLKQGGEENEETRLGAQEILPSGEDERAPEDDRELTGEQSAQGSENREDASLPPNTKQPRRQGGERTGGI